MPLYENSVMYKLLHCNDQDNENIYIGSTTNFRGRKYSHKSNCYNSKDTDYNQYVYQFIRDNGGWKEWFMIPVEVYPCNNEQDLLMKERYYIALMKPTLNKTIPIRTIKEWKNDNKEHVKEQAKKYREDNKEHVKEQGKKYREDNKEHIKELNKQFKQNNKDYEKQYREDNKERITEYKKQYNDTNKDKTTEQRKEQVVCDCGCMIRRSDVSRHKKTKKHIQIMEKGYKE